MAKKNRKLAKRPKVVLAKREREVAARLTMKSPGLLTEAGRGYVAAWLRREADQLVVEGNLTHGRYVSMYWSGRGVGWLKMEDR